PNRLECVLLAFDFVVDGAAAASMNMRPSKLLLGHHLAHPSLHDRRPCYKELANPPDHYREVRSDDPRGAKTRDRTEACAHHWHFRKHRDDVVPGGVGRDVGALHLLESFHAAAATCSIDQPDDWYPLLTRNHFPITGVISDCSLCCSSFDGKVIAADDNSAPFYFSRAQHEVGWCERDQTVVFIAGFARQRSYFMKGAGVEQLVDSLSDSQPARGMLPLNPVGSAHLPGHPSPMLNLVNFLLPAQCELSPRSVSRFLADLKHTTGRMGFSTGTYSGIPTDGRECVKTVPGLRPGGSGFFVPEKV